MTPWELKGRELVNCTCEYGCNCQFNALQTSLLRYRPWRTDSDKYIRQLIRRRNVVTGIEKHERLSGY
jgi:hypothetical protein